MLEKVMNDNKFTLIVSLPKNDIKLVEEALLAGADAVKVHINANHFASGTKFGSFSEEKEFLNTASKLVKKHGKLLGVVPGDGGEYASQSDIDAMADLGVDFMSTYIEFAPTNLLNHKKIDLCGAIGPKTMDYYLELATIGSNIIEASIIEHDFYHTDLSVLDLCMYKRIASSSSKPILIPTQKNVKPSEVKDLYAVGCKGIMIGAVVFKGKESFSEVVSSYRLAIDAL